MPLNLKMLLLLLASSIALCGADLSVNIGNHWNGGFQAKICIPITQELHSWKVHLHFDKEVDSINCGTADVQKTNGMEYILSDKKWNADEHVGDQLCLDIVAVTSGDVTPQITVTVEGMPISGTSSGGGSTGTPSGGNNNHNTAQPGATVKVPASTKVTHNGVGGGEVATTNAMQIFNDWGTRFEAQFEFPVTERIEGWKVDIQWSTSVDKMDVAGAIVGHKSADGKSWTLVNRQDKVFFAKGSTIQLRFFANHAGSKTPTATATLTNLGHDDGSYPAIKNTGGTKYNYDEVLFKSILFYEAQRSGKLPASNRIPWRGDSALGDKGSNGQDLTGGWYDAGDHVKFNLPMAFTTTILTWSLIQWKDAYQKSGQLDHMYDCIKWPLDYLLKCHTAKDELYVQVGNGDTDHNFWGRPEDMTMARPAYKITASSPGSDVAGQTAAAMAAGSIAFKDKDPAYASTLLTHAKQLYDFAMQHQGRYSKSVSAAAKFYPSTNNTDEHAWAGLWLYQATNDTKYLTEAEKYHQPGEAWGMSWDDNQAANNVLFYKLTKNDKYKQDMTDTFEKYWFPNQVIRYTPKGLAWRLQWGSLRYASNMALVALMAAEEGINPAVYREWAMKQLHYALGDTGFSYVIGMGKDFAHSPHHRSSSCPWPPSACGPQVMSSHEPNVHTLFGALVGGPDDSDAYKDDRANYVNNEVACDYNAGFQAAVAGLRSLANRNLHPEQKH
ncbi:endoglucanase 4-like isoform X1 [Haliotis rufescens]|uniref:endoglucanase 4-like isoform X1 n=1 Tax=Haliotis rufescens TaxID=6454 RepID=UPI00201F31B3|nr:endoglucanase 4-like isoform X1 [Haliotis rufescens]